MTLDEFETLVHRQQPASDVWTPVTDYSESARKHIEGPHARLILDTFDPAHAIDVGCGFNYLSKWVNQLAGVQVMHGLDSSNPAADERADIVTMRGMGDHFDLVVCREVLEHLTVLQIRKAVRNLCRLSSQFCYVTTRFAEYPHGLLDVQTSDDLDPTHISLLPKDLMRVLFVLEGFRRRADLEDKMDWRKRGRCLVYERV